MIKYKSIFPPEGKLRVIRLEDADGMGPYMYEKGIDDIRFIEFLENMTDAHNRDVKNHPDVHTDFDSKILEKKNLSSGFISLRDLTNWFGKYYKGLRHYGFRVVVYIVPIKQIFVGKSRKQVLFNKKAATWE